MIECYKLSQIGSSHLSEEGGICQDSCDAKILQNGWVIAAIADGVGSSKHSDVASRMAVDETIQFVTTNVLDSWHVDSLLSLLKNAYNSALEKIRSRARTDGNGESDYDTTLTSLIYNGTNTVFGHVGDGGIIALSNCGDYSLLTEAQKGEEFNSVTPLRAGPNRWLFGSSNDPIAALLMLTDGIYDIACPWPLAKQKQKIWINYVRPFMDRNLEHLRNVTDFMAFQKEIEDFFLKCTGTKDDKTILGIINTDVLPEIKPNEYYAEPNWKGLQENHRKNLY